MPRNRRAGQHARDAGLDVLGTLLRARDDEIDDAIVALDCWQARKRQMMYLHVHVLSPTLLGVLTLAAYHGLPRTDSGMSDRRSGIICECLDASPRRGLRDNSFTRRMRSQSNARKMEGIHSVFWLFARNSGIHI